MASTKIGGHSERKMKKAVNFTDNMEDQPRITCQPNFIPIHHEVKINYDDNLVNSGSKNKPRRNSVEYNTDPYKIDPYKTEPFKIDPYNADRYKVDINIDNHSRLSTDSQSMKKPRKSKSRHRSKSRSKSNKRDKSLEYFYDPMCGTDDSVDLLKYKFYEVLQNSDFCEHEIEHGKRLLNRWISTKDNEAKSLLIQWLGEGLQGGQNDKECCCCDEDAHLRESGRGDCCGNPECRDHMLCGMWESRPRTRDPCSHGNARSSAYFHKHNNYSISRDDHLENVMDEEFVKPCHFKNQFNKQKIDYYISKSYEKLRHDIKQKKQEKQLKNPAHKVQKTKEYAEKVKK